MPKFMNLKKLTEQRTAKQEEMKKLVNAADAEERSLNEEEMKKFEELEKDILGIDTSIRAIQATRDLDEDVLPVVKNVILSRGILLSLMLLSAGKWRKEKTPT